MKVRGVNLEGDRQADLSVHGGPDKAVYAYVSGAVLVDHSLIPRAREAPQLIDSLREQMAELV